LLTDAYDAFPGGSLAPVTDPILTWQASYDASSGALLLRDPGGRVVARVVPADGPPVGAEASLLRRARAALTVEQVVAQQWVRQRGRPGEGAAALVTLVDGTPGRVVNGRGTGWRRRHRNGTISLGDRRYALEHRSRRRSVLLLDGRPLATLRRRGFRAGGLGGDETLPRARLRRTAALTPLDEVATVLALTTLGPPGRRGWWAQLADDLATSA